MKSLISLNRKFYTSTSKMCGSVSTEKQRNSNYYKKLGHQHQIDDTITEEWKNARPYTDIPGPKPIPILGNNWQFLPKIGPYHNMDIIDMYRDLKKQYGNIVRIDKLGSYGKMVMLFNPDDLEKLLRNEGPWPVRKSMEAFTYYRKHHKQDVFKDAKGLISVHGEDWYNFRTVVNPILMQPETVKQYAESIDEVSNDFLDNIRYFATLNKDNEMPKDFQNEINKWALESIGVITLDTRLGCLNLNATDNSESQKLIAMVLEMFDLILKLDLLPSMWRLISTPDWRRFVEILDYITETCNKHIKQCMKELEAAPDACKSNVLGQLVKKDPAIATAMVIDTLLAGIDTTARVMAATLYFLARNPHKQEILRQELRQHLPNKDSKMTKQVLTNLPYLRAVIKESLRICPIAVATFRNSVKDMVFNGYQVPKGTAIVGVNVILCQSDEYFKDAKEFIPERWLRTTTDEYSHKNVHPFVYLPFGFGPRSCIGKRLANLELEIGIAKIVRNFELSWRYEDMTFSSAFLYGIAKPLTVNVKELEN